MKTRLTPWCAGVLVAAAVAPVGASASGTFTVMTDDEKQTKLLDIAANFVPRAEKFYQ
jgi:hypothetical protein